MAELGIGIHVITFISAHEDTLALINVRESTMHLVMLREYKRKRRISLTPFAASAPAASTFPAAPPPAYAARDNNSLTTHIHAASTVLSTNGIITVPVSSDYSFFLFHSEE
jgi:hypothetical protein